MEKEKMDLKKSSSILDYIEVLDNVFPKKSLDVFLKICQERKEFSDGLLGDDRRFNKEERNVKIWNPNGINGSMTEAHWAYYLLHIFKLSIKNYVKDFYQVGFDRFIIKELEILKYTIGGHYKFHADMGPGNPRSISLIYLVNSDYEGGELCFKDIKTNEEIILEKKSNRLVIWPSNFLYPHSVKPVTKGTRYSVVAWAS